LLRDRGAQLHCTIVGDGPLRAELEDYAVSRTALDGHVTFAGALPVGEVIERYRTADVVVLASFSEGVPMVLIEALALGRPVVATAVGGVPELVRDHETGLVVPPGNAAALADAVQWVVEHPVESAALGLAGAALVQREFDLAASASTLHELFGHGGAATSRPASPAAEPEGRPSHGSGEPSPPRVPAAPQLPRGPGAVRSREPVTERSTSAPTRQAPTSANQS
jgi:hypothetical protein